MNFIVYLSSINLLAFIIIFIDKRKAIKNRWRVKENTLLMLSLMGGCFGMSLGMYLFRHKTRKWKFKLVPIMCLVWIYLIFLI